jgi:LuxR family maltose regulon positive regulatory protein
MGAHETAQLLASAGLDLEPASVDALQTKTEGWPGGLYLAILALRDEPDPDAAAVGFSGGDGLVTAFLTEEIFAAMSPDEVDFLLDTAVLTRLSGDLCDDVLGASGSGAMLAHLAQEYDFVIPLDHAGEWYRYHHLIGDMLRAEMHGRDRERVHEVARRASTWFEARREPELAVEHALAAHDIDRAATLVWMHTPAMLAVNRVATVGIWLDRFDAGTVERQPALAVSAAWHAMARGDAPAFHRLRDVLHRLGDARLPDGSPASAVRAIMDALVGRDGLAAMRANAAHAGAELPTESPYRPVAALLEGSAAALRGDQDAARDLLGVGIQLSAGRLPAVHVQCLTQLGRLELADDNPIAAERLADDAVRVMAEADIADRPVCCMCHAFAAVLHLRVGAHSLADEERARGLALSERAEDLATYIWLGCRLDLACAAVMARDLTAARSILDDTQRRLARLPDRGTLDAYADRVAAMLATATAPDAQLVEPLTPAEQRVLARLPTHLTFGQIGEELFLSRNTIKSHAMAIYRKLGVASRNDAVAEATRLHLLDGLGASRPE